MVDVVQLLVGLAALVGGAWLMVRAASRLAVRFGISPAIVGATVVAFGTSAPEFLVSVLASARGSGDLAVGNVLGSNIANMGLVLGIGAVIGPMAIRPRLMRWEIPVLGVATAMVLLFGANGGIGRFEGVALFGALAVFVARSVAIGAESMATRRRRVDPAEAGNARAPWREAVPLAIGVVGLAGGAELLVRGATGLAEQLEISEIVAGAVIVAVGTSLPEVATTAMAAARREYEIAVGNVVGSNVFNLLGVLGLAAIVSPLGIGRELYEFEMPALVHSTAVLLTLARRGLARRRDGLLLLVLYTVFVLGTLARG